MYIYVNVFKSYAPQNYILLSKSQVIQLVKTVN